MRYKRNTSRQRSNTLFAPYFDFEAEQAKPEQDPLEMLIRACDGWIESGGYLIRYGFGVQSEDCWRECQCDGEHDWENRRCHGLLHGTYRAIGKACCPLGALLINTESHFMPMLDAIKILGVSETWGVGFLHGVDNQNVTVIGKNLEKFMKDENYLAGREAGREVAKKYLPAGKLIAA